MTWEEEARKNGWISKDEYENFRIRYNEQCIWTENAKMQLLKNMDAMIDLLKENKRLKAALGEKE